LESKNGEDLGFFLRSFVLVNLLVGHYFKISYSKNDEEGPSSNVKKSWVSILHHFLGPLVLTVQTFADFFLG